MTPVARVKKLTLNSFRDGQAALAIFITALVSWSVISRMNDMQRPRRITFVTIMEG